MKRSMWFVALSLLLLAGCKPSTNTATGGDEENPAVENGNGEVKPPKVKGNEVIREEDLPDNPAVDRSAEQKQVAAMDIDGLIEALGDDKLYLVAVDELADRGPEAVEPLTAAVDSNDEEVRQSAILALGMLGPAAKSALPKLKKIAADDNQTEVIASTAANAVDAIEGK